MPVARLTFGPGISQIRAAGGDVIPSFGGYTADHGWTDIADSCTSTRAVAKAYEKVITAYHVSRLDLDVEDNSLTRPAAIDRRNRAIHLVQRWAARHHRTAEFVYTLPTSTSGLGANGLRVLRSAKRHHARIKVVNIMTFDYYDGGHHEMADDTKSAARALVGQLHQMHPHMSRRQLWAKVAITEMIGIDDFGPAETFTVADARAVRKWVDSKHLAELSFWALQRDNGSCPGTGGSDSRSGPAQSRWRFSHIFEPFTSGWAVDQAKTCVTGSASSGSSARACTCRESLFRATTVGAPGGCFQSVNGQLAVPQLVAVQSPFPSATRADRNLLGLSVGQGRCS